MVLMILQALLGLADNTDGIDGSLMVPDGNPRCWTTLLELADGTDGIDGCDGMPCDGRDGTHMDD